MGNKKLLLVFVMVCAAVLTMIVLGVILIVGAMNLTDGCLYRYSFGSDSSISASDQLSSTAILKANGNYTALSSDSSGGVELDPTAYGQWLNTNVRVSGGQLVKYTIKGDISLCLAYLPADNLQGSANTDIKGDPIVIPRIDDAVTSPVTLYLDAKTDSWRNLTELFQNDQIVVSILPDQKTTSTSVSVYNSVQQGIMTADCREGATTYSPLCGRFSIYGSGTSYTSNCNFVEQCYKCSCNTKCSGQKVGSDCVGGSWHTDCDWCSCYEAVPGTAPEAYKNDGSFTSPWRDNTSELITNFDRDCNSDYSYITGAYQNERYFWFSADNAAGLLYRFSDSSSPDSGLGSGYNFAEIDSDQSFYTQGEDYKIILNTVNSDVGIKYLQYRLYDPSSYSDNTGGYVLNIRQTKCRRSNGNAFNDSVSGRGVVQYVISNYGDNPNTAPPSTVESMMVDKNGDGEFTASEDADGYLWLKIKNDDADYKDSFGQYTVQFFTTVSQGWFYDVVLQPFFDGLKNKIQGAAETIFKNMTCYKGLGDPVSDCTSFFTYIKAMLILYIMFYGMMFLVGMVKITQTDLVIRVIKIGIVAGLMNDTTFNFFNTYVFDTLTGFSDEIISNMSGYSTFSSSTSISNPFMFLNEVMTKIFMSSTFAAQLLATLSMGLNGVLYFVIIFVTLCVVIIVAFRAIAVYIMAFMAITVLIGIAPLFLTFMLFERTRYLFDNWVKFTIRYMIEPVIVLAGIIILTQLFTIYLDYVIGYSVCWKCAFAIKIPFPQLVGITPAFLDVPLFCLYWFAPWGFDSSSGEMGLNMQNIVVLLIIAYCMWGYVDFAHKLVAKLAGGDGGPSAIHMGNHMSKTLGDKALSRIGLDKQSRSEMLKGIKDMRESMRSGKKLNPAEANRRGDKDIGGRGVGDPNDNTSRSNVNRRSNWLDRVLNRNTPVGGPETSAQMRPDANSGNAAEQQKKSTWGTIFPGRKNPDKQTGGGVGVSGADAQSASGGGSSNKSSIRQKLLNMAQLATGGDKKPKEDNSKADTKNTSDLENKAAGSLSSTETGWSKGETVERSDKKLTDVENQKAKDSGNVNNEDLAQGGGAFASGNAGEASLPGKKDIAVDGASDGSTNTGGGISAEQAKRSDGATLDSLDQRVKSKEEEDKAKDAGESTQDAKADSSDDSGRSSKGTMPKNSGTPDFSADVGSDSNKQAKRSDGATLDSLDQRVKSKEEKKEDNQDPDNKK